MPQWMQGHVPGKRSLWETASGALLDPAFPPELQPSLLRLTSDTPLLQEALSDSPLLPFPPQGQEAPVGS